MVPLVHKVLGSMPKDVPMVLPHELFASIYNNYKEQFFTYIVPSIDTLESFWRAVKGTPIVLDAILLRMCLSVV